METAPSNHTQRMFSRCSNLDAVYRPTDRKQSMAHYDDFTEYCYGHGAYHVPGTVNIGWLGASLDFEQMEPDEVLLDLVWDYCKISVAQYRGIHECEYCPPRRSDVG